MFLLLWSLDKMLAPEQTAKIFQFFYKTPLPVSFADPVLRSPGLRERHIPAALAQMRRVLKPEGRR